MPHSRLAEIDLARAMSLSPGSALEAEMRNYNAGGGAWSYEPARASIADIIGARTPLIGDTDPASWDQLKKQIVSACKRGAEQENSNLEVSKLLFDVSRTSGWVGVQEPMGRLSIGFGDSVRYWSDVVLADEDGPFIPFFDHRRGGGLTSAAARLIVFSMQHIGVRERNPDLAEARLAVVRFPARGEGRVLQVHFHDESELLPYEELDGRVRVVYETWARVSHERTTRRRAAGGGSNPFGF